MGRHHRKSWRSLGQDFTAEFETKVLPLRDDLHRVALRLTRSPEAAEDLVQETLLHAYRGFSRFKPGTNLRAWLIRILTNLFISRYRHERRTVSTVSLEGLFEDMEVAEDMTGLLLDENPSPEDLVLDQVLDEEVQEALLKLPEPFRQAVILCDIEGLSYTEAAEAMGVPIGTVRSRLFRGREILRRLLWDYAKKRRWI